MRLLCSLFFVGIVAVGLTAAPFLVAMTSSPLAAEHDASAEEREEQELRQASSRRAQGRKKMPGSALSPLASQVFVSALEARTVRFSRQASFHPPSLKLHQVFRI
jgi:hypothetical protein